MPRPKGSRNRATIAAEAAFRDQIIKEHEANRAAEKPPESPPTPKEVAETIVQREELDLGAVDDKPDPASSESMFSDSSVGESQRDELVDDSPLDLDPPPAAAKKKPSFNLPVVNPKPPSIDKSADTRKTKPQLKPSESPKPAPVICKRPLGGVYRR